MRTLATLLLLCSGVSVALTPDEIMSRVGANQDRAELLRSRYVYTQTTVVRVRDTHGKLTREEVTEFNVAPLPTGTQRKLVRFTGKYRDNNVLAPCDISGEPCGPGFRNEADAHMAHNLRDDLTASRNGRDGLSPRLFPLTTREQTVSVSP